MIFEIDVNYIDIEELINNVVLIKIYVNNFFALI